MAEVLIAGATGGREHALGRAIQRDEPSLDVSFTHGNAGTEAIGPSLGLLGLDEIVDYAVQQKPKLVVIGPEDPLVNGLADRLREYNIPVFGPGADGARLEASKVFTAQFADQFGITQPTTTVVQDKTHAIDFSRKNSPDSYVIKADGLAGGKGVYLPETEKEARETMLGLLSGKLQGSAGRRLVLQRRLDPSAPEFSAYIVTDGKDFTLLPLAQDHKRLLDGDQGPNTGGMGAYTPVPFATPMLIDAIKDIAERTIDGLRDRGIEYRGVLFLGGMLDADNGNKPTLLEYNVRFGDPETQVLMTALQSAGMNIYDLLLSAARGRLETGFKDVTSDLGCAALTVCLAAAGYPDSPRKGDEIVRASPRNEMTSSVFIYHGSTKLDDQGTLVTNGGRVLYVTGKGKSVRHAAQAAYREIEGRYGIAFDGMQYRNDIGRQAIKAEAELRI